MKDWLKENWFKVGIILIGFIFVTTVLFDNYSKKRETQQNLTIVATTSQALQTTPTNKSNFNRDSSSGEIIQSEIEPFKKAVFKVFCYLNGNLYSTGSGFTMDIAGIGKAMITNKHVVTTNECGIVDNNDIGTWNLDVANLSSWNTLTDQAIVKIVTTPTPPFLLSSLPTINSISKIINCPANLPTGSPVIIMGYPASTGGFYPLALGSLTVTRGVISAYKAPITGSFNDTAWEDLPDTNYYVDAQIDSGNSGGLALSKINGKLCLLGMPTWVSLTGNFQAPGIIQSMNNIMYVKK